MLCLSRTLISKYVFCFFFEVLEPSCHTWPVSKGLSGILNQFVLSDFLKVETRISLGLLVVPVPEIHPIALSRFLLSTT